MTILESFSVGAKLAVACVTLAACGRETQLESGPDVRTWSRISFDTLWQIGGTPRDTIFSYLSYALASNEVVYVGDLAKSTVFAIDARNGRITWAFKGDRRQFRSPGPMSILPDSSIAVLDRRRPWIHVLSRRGQLMRALKLPEDRAYLSLCGLHRGRFLLSVANGEHPFALIDSVGQRVMLGSRELPDKYHGKPALALSSQLVGEPRGRCRALFVFASGMVAWEDTLFGNATEYIEIQAEYPTIRIFAETTRAPGGELRINRSESVARDAIYTARGGGWANDTLFVLFNGSSAKAGRIVDKYDAQLRYSGSILLPLSADRLAVTESGAFIIPTMHHGYPVLIALRPRHVH